MNPQFFGAVGSSDGNPLYGVYHGPHRTSDSDARSARLGRSARAVVLCPPIGQEYIRTHWAWKLLAKQLARGGAHVLRFDWSGHGNSSGDIVEQDSLQRWTDDIGRAVEFVREKSNAANVMLVGLRFGATLSALAASERDDIHSLVAWEPVVSGADYLQSLGAMHARMVDLWVARMKTRDDAERKELLGFEFARSLLDEIEQTKLNLHELYLPQLVVELESNPQKFSHVEPSLQRVLRTDDEQSWSQLETLETAWLRPQTTRLVVKTVADMFARLERIGALAVNSELAGAV